MKNEIRRYRYVKITKCTITHCLFPEQLTLLNIFKSDPGTALCNSKQRFAISIQLDLLLNTKVRTKACVCKKKGKKEKKICLFFFF